MTIVNDDSRVVNKLEASLTDNTRVVIYDRHMFIVQATVRSVVLFLSTNIVPNQFFSKVLKSHLHLWLTQTNTPEAIFLAMCDPSMNKL
jgi:hypothetical protein